MRARLRLVSIHVTRTFVEPIAVGGGTCSPCSQFALWKGVPATSRVIGLAPSASHNANLEPLVEGPVISVAGPQAKVRREGCRR